MFLKFLRGFSKRKKTNDIVELLNEANNGSNYSNTKTTRLCGSGEKIILKKEKHENGELESIRIIFMKSLVEDD